MIEPIISFLPGSVPGSGRYCRMVQKSHVRPDDFRSAPIPITMVSDLRGTMMLAGGETLRLSLPHRAAGKFAAAHRIPTNPPSQG